MQQELGESSVDHVTSAIKLVVGFVPMAGPIVAEVIGRVIPNQRIVRFIELLDARLTEIEVNLNEQDTSDPEFIDILEDSFHLAVRALSEDRLKHIANIVATGLSENELKHEETKRMLWLLSQLVVPEVITLRGNLPRSYEEGEVDAAYRDINGIVWMSCMPTNGISIEDAVTQKEIKASYRRNLARLGLLNDQNQATTIGEMFLRYLDLMPERYVS